MAHRYRPAGFSAHSTGRLPRATADTEGRDSTWEQSFFGAVHFSPKARWRGAQNHSARATRHGARAGAGAGAGAGRGPSPISSPQASPAPTPDTRRRGGAAGPKRRLRNAVRRDQEQAVIATPQHCLAAPVMCAVRRQQCVREILCAVKHVRNTTHHGNITDVWFGGCPSRPFVLT